MTDAARDPRFDTLRDAIRAIPDFPKPGILFRDITPLLARPGAFDACLELLAERVRDLGANAVVGIESRGFIFGAALAARMRLPFVPARKPGKLPAEVVRESYALEYGSDTLELHADSFVHQDPSARVVIVDDLIATGGTARAAGALVERAGGQVAGFAFVIELAGLGGAAQLAPHPVRALLSYA